MYFSSKILKSIRKSYGLTQEDCTYNDIDRSLISKIENCKVVLTEDLAIKIARNITNVLELKRIAVRIDYLDFFEDKIEILQTSRELLVKLELYLSSCDYENFEKVFLMLDSILFSNNLPEVKLRFLELTALMAKQQLNFSRSYEFFNRALDIALLLKDQYYQLRLYLPITNVLFMQEKYKEVIDISEFIIKNFKFEFNVNILYYNYGLALKKLKRYDESIIALNKIYLPLEVNNLEKISDVNITIAVCYKKLFRHEVSISLLKSTINLFDKSYSPKVANCYMLIINNYIVLNERKMVENYTNILVRYLKYQQNNSYIFPKLYLEISVALIYLNNLDKAEYFLLKSLKSSKSLKQYYVQNSALLKLLDLYRLSGNSNIDLIISHLLYLIEISKIDINVVYNFFSILGDYANLNDINKLELIFSTINNTNTERRDTKYEKVI